MQKFATQLHYATKKVSLVAFFMLLCAGAFAQAQRNTITASFSGEPLSEVFKALERQDDYRFIFNYSEVDGYKVTASLNGVDMRTALTRVLSGLPFEYSIEGIRITVKKTAGQAEAVPEITVTGSVTDQNGTPLVGVNVAIGSTNRGTVTDATGRYSISTPTGSTLYFSYIGYKSQSIAIGSRTVVNVRMEVEEQKIDDVIVTGYQTISQERSTGSYTIINEETLSKKPSYNISNALTGMVAGMATVTSDVDGQNRFVIRGEGTFGQASDEKEKQIDKDPLIVVDGFPIQGFTTSNLGGDGFRNSKDPFATINPNDVESITVLKDAAATSIYGARAANGVIVITTKKGKSSEKLNITVDGFVSVSSKPDLDYAYNMASAESTFWYMEHLRNYYSSYMNTWFDPYNDPTNPYIYINDAAQLILEYRDKGNISEAEYNSAKAKLISQDGQWKKDLNKLVYRNSVHQQYNVSLRGGSEKVNYSISAAYDNEDSYQKGNDKQRIMINSINSFKLARNLTFNLGLSASIARNNNNGVNFETLKGSISPWTRLVDDSGNYTHVASKVSFPYSSTSASTNSNSSSTLNTVYYPIIRDKYDGKVPASWYYNPVEDAKQMDNTSERFNTRIYAGLEYRIIDGLKAAVNGQYERNQYKAHMLYGADSFYVRNYNNKYSSLNSGTGLYNTYFPAGGIYNDKGDLYEGYTFRAQVDYSKNFGRHDIVAIAGTEILSSTHINDPTVWRYGYNENTNAVLSTVDYVNKYKNIFGVDAYMPYIGPGNLVTLEDRFFSAYANAAYTYDNKYTLSASARTDASNFQAEEVRDKFSPFWSVGAAWLISREGFMENVKWVDYLKLRASVGEAGFAAGKGITSSVTTLGTGTASLIYTNNEAYNTISARGNSTLTWEKSRSFDVGTEFRLWNNRLYGNVSYYNRYSYDVLANASVPIISQGVSTAKYNNAAISNNGVELTLGSTLKAGDFTWNGTLNFAYNKNTVREYNVINTSIRPAYYVGYSINSIWAYNIIGYTSEGYMIMKGKDGTEEIVNSRNATHLYDLVNGAAGEKVEDYNWTYNVGNRTPSTNVGFSSTFSYKGITLSFLLTGKFGYYFERKDSFSSRQDVPSYQKTLNTTIKVYNEGYGAQKSYSGIPLWNEDNKAVFAAGSTWMYLNNLVSYADDYFLRGDHIRLNEVYLGYELPGRMLGDRKFIRSINVFFQAKNLGLIWAANGEGFDPDYELRTIKPMTTFTFGLKFNMN